MNGRIEDYLGKNKKYIYSHLQEKVDYDRFEIIDRTSSYFRLQTKEAIHFNWKKPGLNKQVMHVGVTIST